MGYLERHLHRLRDITQVKDARYKDAGMYVDTEGRVRCTAVLCEWFLEVNTAHGGTSPFPYGLYLLSGDASVLQDPPEILLQGPFYELFPCDKPDPRAVRLNWNETRTQATFGFAPMAAVLGVEAPEGATLWFGAHLVRTPDGLPLIALPLGEAVQSQAAQRRQAAPGTQ